MVNAVTQERRPVHSKGRMSERCEMKRKERRRTVERVTVGSRAPSVRLLTLRSGFPPFGVVGTVERVALV